MSNFEISNQIPLPDGRRVCIIGPLARVCDADAWADPRPSLRNPAYEQGCAQFLLGVAAAGHCGSSGEAAFEWVYEQIFVRSTGDLFGWDRRFIDRGDPATHCAFEGAFGVSPRRTINHLKDRARAPRTKLLEARLLPRMVFLSLARKIWLARAGFPEFLPPYAP